MPVCSSSSICSLSHNPCRSLSVQSQERGRGVIAWLCLPMPSQCRPVRWQGEGRVPWRVVRNVLRVSAALGRSAKWRAARGWRVHSTGEGIRFPVMHNLTACFPHTARCTFACNLVSVGLTRPEWQVFIATVHTQFVKAHAACSQFVVMFGVLLHWEPVYCIQYHIVNPPLKAILITKNVLSFNKGESIKYRQKSFHLTWKLFEMKTKSNKFH